MRPLILLITILSSLHACLWLEGLTIDGSYKRFNEFSSSELLQTSQIYTPKKKFEKIFFRKVNKTLEYQAIEKIMNGRNQEAIDILLEEEAKHPNSYTTASNLGTAYELHGDIQKSIEWIKKGIERNPKSHYSTEWLHILILKMKQTIVSKPNFLRTHHLIDLPDSFDIEDSLTIDGSQYSIKQIKNALIYQLSERMVFVKPKEPIVADLLYTLAKIEEQTTIIIEANTLLDMAIEYGYTNTASIQEIRKSSSHAQLFMYLRYIGYFLLFVIALIFYKRYQKKSSKNSE